MSDDRIDVDYLVVGAGAGGMAFADALIAESDRTALLVDRRHAPGDTGTTRIRSSACTIRPRITG